MNQIFTRLIALLLCAGVVFWPGQTGTFHLDDYPNLAILSYVPPSLSWGEALGHGLSQLSGATRLLPQLSFVLQADAWPGKPEAFISVNILLHLANGLLVFFLARKLALLAGLRSAVWTGFLTSAVWLLSPLQVAAVLYVVQRINQMAALFIFAGALCYLHGRTQIVMHGKSAIVWMMAGIGICGGLAVLSKENGALLPLLLLTAEMSLLPALPSTSLARWSRRVFLFLPILTLVTVLVSRMPSILAGYAKRDFGLADRLLTEPGILFDYMQRFLLPRGTGLGLFHDDYPVVIWPADFSAWLPGLLLLALLIGAVVLRRRWPLPAFAILWFLAGHALESTFIPLELYFEHRNYVPLFGPAFALATWGVAGIHRSVRVVRMFTVVLMAGWLAVSAGVTYSQTSLWGHPPSLFKVWLHDHPDSPRANGTVAVFLARQGAATPAETWLKRLVGEPSPYPEYYALWLQLACEGAVAPPVIATAKAGLGTARYSTIPVNSLAAIADRMEEGRCTRIDAGEMVSLVWAVQDNPVYAGSSGKLQVLAGRFLEQSGAYKEALAKISDAYRRTGNPETGFIELRLLDRLGRRDELEARFKALDRRIQSDSTRLARYRSDIDSWRTHLEQPHQPQSLQQPGRME